MFKLFKRITAKEYGLIFLTILCVWLTVYLELEVPTYMSELQPYYRQRGQRQEIYGYQV